MKNKKLIIIIAAVLILAAVAVFFIMRNGKDSGSAIIPVQSSTGTDTKSNDSNDGSAKDEGSKDEGSKDSDSKGNDSKDSDLTEVYSDNSPITENTDTLEFPFAIKDTQLEVLNIAAYDGVFIEDGSDSDIKNVTAMVLRNAGKTAIEHADIYVMHGDTELQFTALDIPSGAVVVLQEKNRKSFSNDAFGECRASVTELDSLPMAEEQLSITEGDGDSLVVKNISDLSIPGVQVFYKFYAEEQGAFVGGITYLEELDDLAPGEERIITPSYYVSGYSKVVMVLVH